MIIALEYYYSPMLKVMMAEDESSKIHTFDEVKPYKKRL